MNKPAKNHKFKRFAIFGLKLTMVWAGVTVLIFWILSLIGGQTARQMQDGLVLLSNSPLTGITAGLNSIGGNCHWRSQLVLQCEGGLVSGIGGKLNGGRAFMSGNTLNVPKTYPTELLNDKVLSHEWQHARQWAVLGPIAFPIIYFSTDVISKLTTNSFCANIMEWQAGFEDGGYQCSGFAKPIP